MKSIELIRAVMDVLTEVWDRSKQIDDAADEVLDLIEADRKRRGEPVKVPSDAELIQFATDEQFLLFCDEDEFLDIARTVLQRYSARRIEENHNGDY